MDGMAVFILLVPGVAFANSQYALGILFHWVLDNDKS